MRGRWRIEPKPVSVSLRARANGAEGVLWKRVDLAVVAAERQGATSKTGPGLLSLSQSGWLFEG